MSEALPAVIRTPDGSSHAADCPCTRCTGFQQGHTLTLKHGAYSAKAMSPRASEVESWVWEAAPWLGEADAPLVSLFARTVARIEAADSALLQVDAAAKDDIVAYVGPMGLVFDRLRRDSRAWARQAMQLADQLGLTPASRARLQLDVARTHDALASLQERGQRLVEAREER